MIFMLICLGGFIFVIVTLPRALMNRHTDAVNPVPLNGEDESKRPAWQRNPLARDRLECLEMWAEHDADPLNVPPPIPPSHPTKYFGSGNESV
jgi:hypothetical protein